MNHDRPGILGPDGQPLTTEPSIVVIKSRNPPPPQLLQRIGMVTKSSVISLPLEMDLMTGKLAIEEIEAIHGAIHNILEIKEREVRNVSTHEGGDGMAKKLRLVRVAQGHSAYKFAAEIGVHPNMLREIELGLRRPAENVILKACDILGKSPNELFSNIGDTNE